MRESRDRTHILIDTSHVLTLWATTGLLGVEFLIISKFSTLGKTHHTNEYLFLWSGHARWLFFCSLYIPCWTTAYFTYTLLTGLTYLCTCPRLQLVIVLIKGAVRGMPGVSLVTNEPTWGNSPFNWQCLLTLEATPAFMSSATQWGVAPGPCFRQVSFPLPLHYRCRCGWLQAPSLVSKLGKCRLCRSVGPQPNSKTIPSV